MMSLCAMKQIFYKNEKELENIYSITISKGMKYFMKL